MKNRLILIICAIFVVGGCVFSILRLRHFSTYDFSAGWSRSIEKIILRYPNSVFENHLQLMNSNASAFEKSKLLPTSVEIINDGSDPKSDTAIVIHAYWCGHKLPTDHEMSLTLGTEDYICVKVTRVTPDDIAGLLNRDQQMIEIRFNVPSRDFLGAYCRSSPPKMHLNNRNSPIWEFAVGELINQKLDKANLRSKTMGDFRLYWFHGFRSATLVACKMNK